MLRVEANNDSPKRHWPRTADYGRYCAGLGFHIGLFVCCKSLQLYLDPISTFPIEISDTRSYLEFCTQFGKQIGPGEEFSSTRSFMKDFFAFPKVLCQACHVPLRSTCGLQLPGPGVYSFRLQGLLNIKEGTFFPFFMITAPIQYLIYVIVNHIFLIGLSLFNLDQVMMCEFVGYVVKRSLFCIVHMRNLFIQNRRVGLGVDVTWCQILDPSANTLLPLLFCLAKTGCCWQVKIKVRRKFQ
eukprot:TRINITY_DN104338_c0_g1_i1.p1 TRINITY_DN104338_c0_g1~~TRINITY_DN104338_c0_g1_i1.p1  ORF type:complete len:241 (-),score=-12.27 TRINITY_DN104338_c0_g1_i1:44-766(-)